MEPRPDILTRCFQWARSTPVASLPENAPLGFATRVLGQLRTPEARDWTLWLMPRAVAAAVLIATSLLAINRAGELSIERDLEAGLMASALEVQP